MITKYFETKFLILYNKFIIVILSSLFYNFSQNIFCNNLKKKSARLAGTFSLRASRAARFARTFERAQGARFDRRASRSVILDRRP